MGNFARMADRRQFGRRWSKVHAWVCIDGRPRTACIVRNFSEGGALLWCDQADTLPLNFRLIIDAIGFEIGCEVRHSSGHDIGVRFISPDLVSEIGPVWTIEEKLARSTHLQLQHDPAA